MANNAGDPNAPIDLINLATVWGKTAIPSTSIEQVRRQAQIVSEQQQNRLADFKLRNVAGGHTGTEER
ncbi:MAG TPA: hypothetical protein VGG42_17075 [Acidobacteriaceae bacterium]